MAGRIRDDDIALVRERVRIDEVVSPYVTLRPGGADSMKGLCPFHDEKSPSFHVRPQAGFFHCFGCEEGGDAIAFLQKIEGLSFVDAVERLAGRTGVQLRYVDGGGQAGRREPGNRARLLEAHSAAAEFYTDQLHSSGEAGPGRTFLAERGFDQEVARTFGLGYAPRGGEALLDHLRRKGFGDEELGSAGLAASGARGHYDRFRGRLLWPIRELSGEVVGFGARRLYDDDRVEAKYLNTPETPIFHKSRLLYGVDLARREIAKQSQAVVVEGYTDVMAAHLAGVETAVATCGTAFGEEHVRVLRRLLLDHDEFRGEVIFTFDGDEAGQRAAVRAFEGDQQFVAQTYVAIEPDGHDPCELRLAKGDAAVRDLIARRTPLYRFVLTDTLRHYDLDRADGRVNALRAAAPLVTSVRDQAKVGEYARELASLLGMDLEEVRAEVRRAGARGSAGRGAPGSSGRGSSGRGSSGRGSSGRGAVAPAGQGRADRQAPVDRHATPTPDAKDPRLAAEREVLKVVIQHPATVNDTFDEVVTADFTHPAYAAVREAIGIAGGAATAAAGEAWVTAIGEHVPDDAVRQLVTALAVEPLHAVGEPSARYATSLVARVRELAATRRIGEVKSRLQRTNPVEATEDYNRMFGQLIELEQHRRQLRDLAAGGLA